MTQQQLYNYVLSILKRVGVTYIDPCTLLQVGDCLPCGTGGGETSDHPAVVLAQSNAPFTWNTTTQVGNISNAPILTFNSVTGDMTWIPGDGTAPVVFNVKENSTEVLTTGPVTIDGVVFITGSTLQSILEALSLADHPPASITNTLAPFAWDTLTQIGNMPLQDTLVLNGNGTATFTPGSGAAATIIPYLDNTTTVLTTGLINIGSAPTVYAIGTTTQTILTALAANDTFTINAGTTAVNSDAGLGIQSIKLGTTAHLWSSDGSVLWDVNTTNVDARVVDMLMLAPITVLGTIYPAGTSILTILASLNGTGLGSGTDLSLSNHSTNTLDVNSSTGVDVTLPAATPFLAGLMTATHVNNLANLILLSGVSGNSVNLGTFTGNTITDSQTIKQALQLLETSLETKQISIQFQNEGVALGTSGTVTEMDFVGVGVTATRVLNKVTVEVLGAGTPVTETFENLASGNTVVLTSTPLPSQHVTVFRNGMYERNTVLLVNTIFFATTFGVSGGGAATEDVVVQYFA